MKKFVFGGIVSAFCLMSMTYGLTSPYVKEQQLGIDLYLESDSLDYTPPTRFKPSTLEQAPQDASYWINSVLPFAEDRNENIYLVIPQIGLITPVVDIPKGTSDFNLMKNGNQIEVNKYLKGGIIEYVGSSAPGVVGKRIDFGHSNYYKSDDGRYKAIFANLMALDVGDEVWYYVKQGNGTYKLFKYRVNESYNTHPSNVGAMKWDGNGADALIFGCTHGLDGRWMIQASYIGSPIDTSTTFVEEDKFADISVGLKARIKNAIAKIDSTPLNHKKYAIIRFFKVLAEMKENTTDPQKLLVIDYVETLLADIYPE